MTTITIVEAAILAHLSHIPLGKNKKDAKILISRLGPEAKKLVKKVYPGDRA